ncbi:hypothetical protein VTK73DRAFT_8637 [Phialemonium thermophilum]|uniref:Uncharacterized protein n=1 Tax=Phialemonium thermophilum TaxID=223376 RepID=A0ABR3W796_9PEZI
MRSAWLRRVTSRKPAGGLYFGCRHYRPDKAQVTVIHAEGMPLSYETDIRLGEPHEAYVYIEPDVGTEIHSSITRQLGLASTRKPEKLSLVFDHLSRHFRHGTFSPRCRRVIVFIDLGQKHDPSPAWKSLETFHAKREATSVRQLSGSRAIGILSHWTGQPTVGFGFLLDRANH